MPKLPNHRHCMGCMACVDSCTKDAIRIVPEHGLRYPMVDLERCIGCRLCEKHCPVLSPVNFNKREDLWVKGGWCRDTNARRDSASGGAFSAFALYVLDNGGYAIGASLDKDGKVVHKVVNKAEDLFLLQNSKYIQSNTFGIYKETKKLLTTGRQVLFSGTPCQTAALNSYLGRDYDNLITIDLICNGVPSDDAVNMFEKENDVRHIVSFRGKKYGWHDLYSQGLTYETNIGSIVSPEKSRDLFYKIFSCGLTHRSTCCDCQYSSLPRYADITIADFWGISRFKEEWNDGISLIIANNRKGLDFIDNCKELHIFDSTLQEAVKANPRIVNGKKYHGWHPVMLWRTKARKLVGERIYRDIITNKMPYRLLWGVLKVMTIISNKLATKKEVKYEQTHRHNNNI